MEIRLKNKKTTKMSEEFFQACFCGNTIYYTRYGDDSLYKINIRTGKNSPVTKKDVMPLLKQTGNFIMCITSIFICTVKEKKIKKYSALRKKIEIFKLDTIDSDSGKIAVTYITDDGKTNVAIYDTKASVFSKIEDIRDITYLRYFAGDMLFYSTTYHYEEKYISSLSYPICTNLKKKTPSATGLFNVFPQKN